MRHLVPLLALLCVASAPAFGQSARPASREVTHAAEASRAARKAGPLYFTYRELASRYRPQYERTTHYDGPRRWVKLQAPRFGFLKRSITAREADQRLEGGMPVLVTPFDTQVRTVWFGKHSFRNAFGGIAFDPLFRGPRLIDRAIDRPIQLADSASAERWFNDYGRSTLAADVFWSSRGL